MVKIEKACYYGASTTLNIMSIQSPTSIATDQPGYFTPEQLGEDSIRFFKEKGYLVLVGGFSAQEVAQLNREMVAICRGERGEMHMRNDGNRQHGEIDIDALAELSDEEVISKFLCIHQVHKFSDVMFRALAQPNLVRVLTGVVSPNVKCMQSMLFIKASGKPGQAWHQDEDYIPTRDRSLIGAWIALDDATVENGCLWVIPGSHSHGVLWPQYPHNNPDYDCATMAYDFPYADSDAVPVEVPAGSIVFFNGYLLHKSLPNRTTGRFRRALVNHYMSAESLLPWRHREDISNAKNDYRDIVLVAGEDPYAWKGTEDISRAYIRPAGQGGCGDGRTELESFRKKSVFEREKA